MEQNKFGIRDGLQLRKIGSRYMVVDACEDNVNLSHVYSLNGTAAWMWERLAEGISSPDELTDRLCEDYQVERERAFHDVEKQLTEWLRFGLVVAGK